jgi:uncharacterized damage-inducible protein DinB
MKIDDIKLVYEYNYWAGQRTLAICANVSPEQYVARTSDCSLRTTFIHILDAEWEWRIAFQKYFVAIDTLKERSPADGPKRWNHNNLTEADLPPLDSLNERWQAEERAMRSYLDNLSDQDLTGFLRYLTRTGIVREQVLWHYLLHLVNHSTQHRSEVAALLTSYGQSPGDLDFTLFLNEHFNLPS